GACEASHRRAENGAYLVIRLLFLAGFSGGFTFNTSAITSLNGRGMCGIGFEFVIFFSPMRFPSCSSYYLSLRKRAAMTKCALGSFGMSVRCRYSRIPFSVRPMRILRHVCQVFTVEGTRSWS